uniref:Uncharacterized protein n=1 Tax=Anguilla anguilla TaxID=7936 RepID=A0A0E9QC05_ANGAN
MRVFVFFSQDKKTDLASLLVTIQSVSLDALSCISRVVALEQLPG